jgi:rRNA maturation endonuclease Nob1
MDAGFIQKRMHELQNDASFQGALGKLVSGRAGYKPVIEKKYIPIKCKNCNSIVDDSQKFCHECGAKIEK